MTTSAWISAALGLVGALIGAAAALTGQHLQWRHDRRSVREASQQQAVEDVLVHAVSIDMVAHQIAVTVKEFTSLNGFFDRVFRVIQPLDFQPLFSALRHEADSLNRAAAQVWMSADQEMVRRTNIVVLTAMEVVEAHSRAKTASLWQMVVRIIRGHQLGDPVALAKSRERLSEARRELGDAARSAWNLPPIDLFAGSPATAW